MADLSKIKVGSTTYNLKDTSARADISELNTEVSQQSATKVDKAQGAENVGKVMTVGADGNLSPQTPTGGVTSVNGRTGAVTGVAEQNMISDAWSSLKSYAAGDYSIDNNTLYKCKVQHSNQRPPNTTYWEVVNLSDEIKNAYIPKGITVTNCGGGAQNTDYTYTADEDCIVGARITATNTSGTASIQVNGSIIHEITGQSSLTLVNICVVMPVRKGVTVRVVGSWANIYKF